ncbi:hypothetical protein D3C85_1243770 [compost metagenome]
MGIDRIAGASVFDLFRVRLALAQRELDQPGTQRIVFPGADTIGKFHLAHAEGFGRVVDDAVQVQLATAGGGFGQAQQIR